MDNTSKIWKILEELKRLKRAGILVDENVIKYAEELVDETTCDYEDLERWTRGGNCGR